MEQNEITIKDKDGDRLTLTIGESVSWINARNCLAFMGNDELIKLAHFILEKTNTQSHSHPPHESIHPKI